MNWNIYGGLTFKEQWRLRFLNKDTWRWLHTQLQTLEMTNELFALTKTLVFENVRRVEWKQVSYDAVPDQEITFSLQRFPCLTSMKIPEIWHWGRNSKYLFSMKEQRLQTLELHNSAWLQDVQFDPQYVETLVLSAQYWPFPIQQMSNLTSLKLFHPCKSVENLPSTLRRVKIQGEPNLSSPDVKLASPNLESVRVRFASSVDVDARSCTDVDLFAYTIKWTSGVFSNLMSLMIHFHDGEVLQALSRSTFPLLKFLKLSCLSFESSYEFVCSSNLMPQLERLNFSGGRICVHHVPIRFVTLDDCIGDIHDLPKLECLELENCEEVNISNVPNIPRMTMDNTTFVENAQIPWETCRSLIWQRRENGFLDQISSRAHNLTQLALCFLENFPKDVLQKCSRLPNLQHLECRVSKLPEMLFTSGFGFLEKLQITDCQTPKVYLQNLPMLRSVRFEQFWNVEPIDIRCKHLPQLETIYLPIYCYVVLTLKELPSVTTLDCQSDNLDYVFKFLSLKMEENVSPAFVERYRIFSS